MSDTSYQALWAPRQLAAAAFAAACGLLVPLAYFDQFSWFPDDGAYAYVASQILDGAVLNLDVQDVHAGYINFFNAAALALFGESFVSLRWPLVILTALQSLLVFFVTLENGRWTATLCAVVFSSLTFVHFLNPTANWYCLFLFVALVAVLSFVGPQRRSRVFAIGFLLGLMFLTRQLTGVFIGIGVFAYLIYEGGQVGSSTRARPVQIILGLTCVLVGVYAWRNAEPAIFFLIGIWPVLIGLYALSRANIGLGQFWVLAGRLAIGGLLAAVPLLGYHLANSSAATFIDDVVFAAISLSQQDFIQSKSYLDYLYLCISQLLDPKSPAQFVNSIFWIALILAPAILGATVLARLRGARKTQPLPPIVFIGVFYTLVSLHYQIPIYLVYTSAPAIASLLVLSAGWRASYRYSLHAATVFLVVVGLHYHAGQPLSRGIQGTLSGTKVDMSAGCAIAKLGLRVEQDACERYQRLLTLIAENSNDADTILAVPVNPELYFLSNRTPPVRFFSSALGIRNTAELATTLANLNRLPPKLLIYFPGDKYNTPYTQQLVESILDRYTLLEAFDGFNVYVMHGSEDKHGMSS